MPSFKPGDPVWVKSSGGERAAVIHSHLWGEWWALTDVQGLPTPAGKRGWRAESKRIRPRRDDDSLKLVSWDTCLWKPKELAHAE